MFKRHFSLVLVLLLILTTGSVLAQDTIELTIGGVASGDELTWLQEVVKPEFEAKMAEEGTNVTVNVVEFVGDDLRQQYVLDLGVGEGPDIMSFDGFWLPEFVEGGLLQPLTSVVGEEVLEWDGWDVTPEGLKEIIGFNGELYGIARGTDARVIWYRADLLEQAGLPADWQPTSWAELLDAARAVKDNLEGVTPLQLNAGTAMGEATTMQGYLMALLGAGHHIYDFDEGKWIVSSPGILDTLNLYKTIYVDEELGDPRFQLSQNGRDQSFEAFSNGEVAMLVEGDYFWRGPLAPETGNFPMANRDEVVKFAFMPAEEPGAGFNGQDFVTISGGTGYVLNPNTDHPQEAWELLTYMFSLEALEGLQEIQPRIRARTDVPVTGDETMSRIAEEVLPMTTIRPQLPEYNRVSTEAQLMTERVVSGEMTPEEAMQAYDEAVTEIVGEENVLRIPVE
ncbi:MAG: ABC transporter substrate-binding protein [Anaerolineaceae bacterium]|nr:ABC transporter substrate-binding protein [Anaerolineaceae bacterium]